MELHLESSNAAAIESRFNQSSHARANERLHDCGAGVEATMPRFRLGQVTIG